MRNDDPWAIDDDTLLPRTGLSYREAHSRLTHSHLSQESLSEGERRILHVAEALVNLIEERRRLSTTDALRSLREHAERLNRHLGPDVVAQLTGAEDAAAVGVWPLNFGRHPGYEQTRRLRFARAIWEQVADLRDNESATGWFTEPNVHLDSLTPLEAVRGGQFVEVAAAARSLQPDSGTTQ